MRISYFKVIFIFLILISLNINCTKAATLSNSRMIVNINDVNGAIYEVELNGKTYYHYGSSSVSDWGFQVNNDKTTFKVNQGAENSANIPVNLESTSNSIKVSGIYNNIKFNRTYSLAAGQNVLRTATTLLNTGSDITINYFDIFDPNPDKDTSPKQDVFKLDGISVAQATGTNSYSIIIGSQDSDFAIEAGAAALTKDNLNSLYTNPSDPNGAISANGINIGIKHTLTSGSTYTYTFDQAYGSTSQESITAFAAANPAPEPSSAILGMLGICGLYGIKRRKTVKLLLPILD